MKQMDLGGKGSCRVFRRRGRRRRVERMEVIERRIEGFRALGVMFRGRLDVG
jgi:hypothetical protein